MGFFRRYLRRYLDHLDERDRRLKHERAAALEAEIFNFAFDGHVPMAATEAGMLPPEIVDANSLADERLKLHQLRNSRTIEVEE